MLTGEPSYATTSRSFARLPPRHAAAATAGPAAVRAPTTAPRGSAAGGPAETIGASASWATTSAPAQIVAPVTSSHSDRPATTSGRATASAAQATIGTSAAEVTSGQ